MGTRMVKLGKVAEYIEKRVDTDCSNSGEYVSTENLQSNKLGVSFPSSSYPTVGKVGVYQTGDILISNIRPYFKKIWQANKSGTNSLDVLNIRTTSDALIQDFLAVVLSDDRFFDFMMTTAKGTKMPRGDKSAIMEYKFILPELTTQQRVVHIVSAINAKIELNQQINSNLLKLMNGMFHKNYLADKRVQVSNTVKLSNMVRTKSDTFNPKKTKETFVNYFSMPAFDAERFPVVDAASDIKSNKNVVEPFSILVSKMNPDVKRVWLPNTSKDLLNVASTEFLTFNADVPEMQAFVYAVVNDKRYQKYLESNTTGSTNSRQRVLPKVAYSYEIPYVKEVAQQFGFQIMDIIDMIKLNKEQNQHLIRLRNVLVPKLLAGDIDLSNIETVMNNNA
ncbi:restriction endonuclease subunit S [Lacticaseibacillus paracasei]|uniref:restriction endonuclease subunit S n=1 Tax=Lacticaseibacillus paracasei TaxID=1597 RepID=UPI0022E70803|nr:restriction endonuclease subunit S [Lacticaseibacillus paracasei]